LESHQALIAQIDGLFHPRSIAIVGAPREVKTGSVFLMGLLEQGFPGPIYPVNPEAGEIRGLKAYPRIKDIPGPVDLAIILVPVAHVLSIVKECAAKGVKGAVLFTSGFKETGTEEGKALEEALVRVARSAGMRLVGPNGMGLYCPKTGLSFFPGVSKDPGPVGIISHSGSLTNILGNIAPQKGLRFSKVISSGNDCDLTAADFITYLGHDPDTGLIGGYIEGIKDGPHFLRALKQASLKKPVIIWKVGLTPEGSQASASHTGALAGSRKIWQAVQSQTGAIPVFGFEAWFDALMGFSLLPAGLGRNVAIISGPGGLAVSAAEALGNEGLSLAFLSEETQDRLNDFVPPTGTSLRNPVDVSLAAFFDPAIFKQSTRIVAADPGVDALIIIGGSLTPEDSPTFLQNMVEVRRESQKPMMMVRIPSRDPKLDRQFCEAGIPFFDSSERAVRTFALVYRYQRWRQNHPEP
jgi:acetate---CoA ligase (ADP-forming) subunit alpha